MTDRAACRVCRRRVKLDASGRVASHPSPASELIECDGVGYLPATPEPVR